MTLVGSPCSDDDSDAWKRGASMRCGHPGCAGLGVDV